MKKNSRRNKLSISAGSMADIAFLMLIFFLVATTIAADKGILVKLPPYEKDVIPQPIKDRNVLTVHVNSAGELMVEGETTEMEKLKDLVKEHVANPQKKEHYSEKPTKAVVSLMNDRNTSYTTYITVYDNLKTAYRELWEEHTRKTHNEEYTELTPKEQKQIRNDYPQIISEAEASDFTNPE